MNDWNLMADFYYRPKNDYMVTFQLQLLIF